MNMARVAFRFILFLQVMIDFIDIKKLHLSNAFPIAVKHQI